MRTVVDQYVKEHTTAWYFDQCFAEGLNRVIHEEFLLGTAVIFMAAVSTALNVLGGAVLLSYYLSDGTYRIWIASLCFSDGIYLLSLMMQYVTRFYIPQCIRYSELLFLKGVHVLSPVFQFYSTYVTVCISGFRFLAVYFPFLNVAVTKVVVYRLLLFLLVFSISMNWDEFDVRISICGYENDSALYFISYEEVLDDNSLEGYIWWTVWIIFRIHIPLVAVILLNALTLRQIMRTNHSFVRNQSTASQRLGSNLSSRLSQSNQEIQILTIAISVIFIVCSLPRFSRFVVIMLERFYLDAEHYAGRPCSKLPGFKSPSWSVRIYGAVDISEALNAALNFLLYLSFNRQFRRDIRRITRATTVRLSIGRDTTTTTEDNGVVITRL